MLGGLVLLEQALNLALRIASRPRQILPGLLARHFILVLAQPRRKRDPDSPMGESPAL